MWEGEFHPHQPLMRSEALELLARAFHVSEKDIASLDSWLTDAFPSDLEEITRGEFAAALGSVLGLGQRTSFPAGFYPSFGDVEPGYPGALAAELLKMLEVLPHHMHGRFESYRLVTRSEAAFMLDEATQFERITGEVAGIDGEEGRLLIDERPIQLTAETIFLTADGFEGDELGVGEAIEALVKTKSPPSHSGQGSYRPGITAGPNNQPKYWPIIDPSPAPAILEGDWDQLNEEVQYQVYEELMARRAGALEADALLKQDWVRCSLWPRKGSPGSRQLLRGSTELVHATPCTGVRC